IFYLILSKSISFIHFSHLLFYHILLSISIQSFILCQTKQKTASSAKNKERLPAGSALYSLPIDFYRLTL
ncbi:hypothetical protein RFX65_18650, partial [Acinetobacter baumannii]|nr:hypothetical protein [Acinetobacter baumannii]